VGLLTIFAGIADSKPTGDMDDLFLVSVVCFQVELCDGLITRPEEFYRVRCIWLCSWSLDNENALATRGCRAMGLGGSGM